MNNKGYCIIKAKFAEKRGRKKEAVHWYAEAGNECLRQARKCQLLSKMIDTIITFGG